MFVTVQCAEMFFNSIFDVWVLVSCVNRVGYELSCANAHGRPGCKGMDGNGRHVRSVWAQRNSYP